MSNVSTSSLHQNLVRLGQDLGREDRGLAILGEGNVSGRMDAASFLVKASGSCLATLEEPDLVACAYAPLLALIDRPGTVSDQEVDDTLLSSRCDPSAKKPSVEAMFHAWLLSLPDVNFVGHTHPVSANQILCSPRATDFASHRMFPDEIVCCGVASVFVPYADPGLVLAQSIRDQTRAFIAHHGRPPQVILLENHGVITLGPTVASILSAMRMTEKAARIFSGAASLGGPVFLSAENVARIAGRPDEHYRQRALNLFA